MKALAMMTEKERGVVEGANFKTLWEVLTDLDGQIRYASAFGQLTASKRSWSDHVSYRHAITGKAQSMRPTIVYGGLLADVR
jgi:hypothetical protein